jgi:hypothetical protein
MTTKFSSGEKKPKENRSVNFLTCMYPIDLWFNTHNLNIPLYDLEVNMHNSNTPLCHLGVNLYNSNILLCDLEVNL